MYMLAFHYPAPDFLHFCRYFNKGHCKYRERCKFNHPKEICKTYLDCGKCEIENCRDRHQKCASQVAREIHHVTFFM